MTSSTTPAGYQHCFRWDSSVPNQVFVRGSFDQWQSSIELAKEPSGKFGTIIELDHGSKVFYKYIIDGDWRHNPNEPTETDEKGNVNNFFQVPEYVAPDTRDHHKIESDPIAPQPSASTIDKSVSAGETYGVANENATQSVEEHPGDLPNTAVFPSQSEPRPISPPLPSPSARAHLRSTHLIGLKQRSTSSSSSSRFRRTSYHAHSLLASSPGMPNEKSSPAGVSVSTVVSAMAGAAATAIPAAIFAVTGKDLMRDRTPSESRPAEASSDAPDTTRSLPAQTVPAIPSAAPALALNEEESVIVPAVPSTNTLASMVSDSATKPPSPRAAIHTALPPVLESKASELSLSESTEPTTPPPLAVLSLNDPTHNTAPGAPSAALNDAVCNTAHKDPLAIVPLNELAKNTAPDAPLAALTLNDPVHNTMTDTPSVSTQAPLPVGEGTTTASVHGPGQLGELPPAGAEVPDLVNGQPLVKKASLKTQTAEVSGSSAPIKRPDSVTDLPTPTTPTTPQPAALPSPSANSGAKYDGISPMRKAGEKKNGGGWRASVGSFRRPSNQLEDTESRRASRETQHRIVSEAEDSSAKVGVETTPRKRKISLFHKIKTALSPHHKA